MHHDVMWNVRKSKLKINLIKSSVDTAAKDQPYSSFKLLSLVAIFALVFQVFAQLAVPTVVTAADEIPSLPNFPPCTQLLSTPGDLAHYTEGLHQIAGDGLLEGADDVYALVGNGNAVQCFCPKQGTGIQTNWWKTDATSNGWIQIANGADWNLSEGAYLAINSYFDCNPPTFPVCEQLFSTPGDLAHYTEGLHQIAGGGVLSGADDVYSQTFGNAVQCFCPADEEGTGIQTNWWNIDASVSGWIDIANGADWNLESGHYLAINSNFDCGDVGGEEVGANITVTKVVINDNGGTAVASDFLLKVGQAVVTSGVLATNFPAGTYNVTESGGPSGYSQSFGGDCNSSGEITMAPGHTYSCTVSNNDLGPTFPICIDLLNNPGDLAHYTTGLHQIAGGGLLAGADDVYSLTNGNAVQCFCPTDDEGTGIQTNWWNTSLVIAGWVQIANGLVWNLSDHAYLAFNSDFECEPAGGDNGGGGQPTTLKVIKVVVNDNDGDSVVSDFALKVNDTNVVSEAVTTFTPGEYTVTETGPAGYTATFSGDCNSSGHVTIVAGHTYTCTITNNDDAPVGGVSSGGGGGGGGSGISVVTPPVTPSGSISGNKFNDKNGNGVWDTGEPGLANWTIYLDLNNNSTWDSTEPFQGTNASGAYTFTGINVGTYYVRELGQTGWIQKYPTAASSFAHFVGITGNNTVPGVNFGNTQGQILGIDVGGGEDLPRTGQSWVNQLVLFLLLAFAVIKVRKPRVEQLVLNF